MGGLQRVQARGRPRLGGVGVGVERRGRSRGRRGRGLEPAPGSVGVGVGGERRGAARAPVARRGKRECGDLGEKRRDEERIGDFRG